MINREQLDEIENVIRDLRMALDFKEQADRNEPFVIVPTATPITVVFDTAKRKEIDDKVSELETNLNEKMIKLKQTRAKKVI